MNVTSELRQASCLDASTLARLLIDFNSEFDTPCPSEATLAQRFEVLLDTEDTVAFLAGAPAVGFALITCRTNVNYSGKVALLDELYVAPPHRNKGMGSKLIAAMLQWADSTKISAIEINVDEPDVDAQRFYERHGFSGLEQPGGYRAFYYYKELRD